MQVAHATVAFMFVLFFCAIMIPAIVLPILSCANLLPDDRAIANWVGNKLRNILFSLLPAVGAPLLLQIVLNKYVFFDGGWVMHRRFFAFYDYNMMCVCNSKPWTPVSGVLRQASHCRGEMIKPCFLADCAATLTCSSESSPSSRA